MLRTKITRLKNHQGFMKYFKNTSWLLGEKIMRMVVGLFVGIWVARYLGPEQFGLFSYAQSFVGLFTAIATLGLNGIVVRELVKDESRRDSLIGTAFWLKVIGALVVLIILAIAVNFTSNDSYTNILVFIIASATIFQSFNVVDFYFQSKVMSKFVVYANIISLLLSSIIKVLLILNEAPLEAFAWVILFDSFVLACGFIYFYIKNDLSVLKWKFNKIVAYSLLKDSWPLIFSGTALMIQAYIDQVMIKEMIGTIEVGYYSVAMRLIAVFGFIPMLLKSSLFPAIQNAKKQSDELYQNRLLNYYRFNFLLFLITAIPIFIFAEQIVILLFGIEYKNAGVLLALMTSRLLFANMGVSRGAFILTENLMRFSMLTMILGTITNVLLNYLWIPEYGAKGAIVATIFSFIVTVFIVDIFYTKTRKNVQLQIKSMLTFYKINIRK
ncbi:MAG: flippase [Methylococcales bacterium]|nr:flippase [Methylococcales bacterium]